MRNVLLGALALFGLGLSACTADAQGGGGYALAYSEPAAARPAQYYGEPRYEGPRYEGSRF